MWQLTISISKTFILHIGLHNPHHIYNINDIAIGAVESVKDLGVFVTSDI
jgi:hypothetical protein